jgi:signal transduction histidine kinase/ActR/RegA family two-component response regulator
MTEAAGPDEATRVLLLPPTRKDGATARDLLAGAGLACHVCDSLAELCREIPRGAGVVVVPEEAARGDGSAGLAAALRGQPPWSDLPVLVLTAARRPGERAPAPFDVGGVTLLRRPLDVGEFLTAVRAALRDRRRQYQVRDHLAEQARQAAALREADRRKDEFLAMLAHELRNPLAPIRNGLQVLRLADGDRSVVNRIRDMMDRQVQHLSRLVDDLLDVSRITRGKAELRTEAVDLNDVLARAVEAVRPLLDARRHRLTVSQPGRPVWVSADPTRLIQVVGNLLNNAAKYSEESAQIALALEEDGGRAVVRVRDTGVGIPPDMLPKVFDLFTQVDRTVDRSQGGLGIGLTLVRTLVEMHGGTVEASSDGIGTGSEFVVRLPALPAGAVGRAGSGAEAGAPPAAYRVLVVDDNPDARDSLAELLRLTGHEVRTAPTGPKAIEVARAWRPDVALLDLGLPGMDGYEVARVLRAEPFGGSLLLVALTGYGQDEDRRRTQEVGFDHHLTKPADPHGLARLLAGHRPGHHPPG